MNIQSTTKQREPWLDLAKGMIILLVVMIHVMQGIQVAGYGLSYEWLLQSLIVMGDFAMPLFFALSGYLYTWEQPSDWSGYKRLIVKKMIRLGIPYVLFSMVQGTLRILLNGQTNINFEWSNLFFILLQPFDQFWFLYALFVVFLLVPLLDLLLKRDWIVLCVLLTLALWSKDVTFLPLALMFSSSFYFYLGVYLKRYGHGLMRNRLLLLMAGLAYVISRVQLGLEPEQQRVMSILLAITGSMLTFYCCWYVIAPNRPLRAIFNVLGLYSFEIYLLHVLLTAPTRMILLKLCQIENFWILLALGLLAGLLLPILIIKIAEKIPLLEFCFYPGKYIGQKARKQKTQVSSVPA